ncbi:MAG: hypothetical protein J3Q66DRAFT_364127 [Benniella sp.]|nr:MAG: hypothetical protein J3Q66DRAFT_364127 [Benniella sp.]
MLPYLSFPTIFTLLIFTLSFLSNVFLIHPVLAQGLRPAPNHAACSAFIEGQGFYILGGRGDDNFMIDLSVSWNTSDPVFKKLEGGPRTMGHPCATTNNELFTLVEGTGYVYNVSSGSWRVFHYNDFDVDTRVRFEGVDGRTTAIANPDTETLYFPNLLAEKVLSVNLRTGAYNISDIVVYSDDGIHVVLWNAYLKSVVFVHALYTPVLYTPSKVTKTSNGMSELNFGIGPKMGPEVVLLWACGTSAHGGTKMVFLEGWGPVYVVDVAKGTWKNGPPGPRLYKSSCAVTGDQFIIWGGLTTKEGNSSNKTFVFNIKTMKWTSGYVAPPRRSTTTAPTHTSQPSQTPTQNVPQTTTGNPGDMNFIIIIIVATGILLATNLWFIVRHHRRRGRSNPDIGQKTSPDWSSTDSLDIMDDNTETSVKWHSIRSPHLRDTFDSSANSTRLPSDHNTGSRWYMSGLLGRLHQGTFGARELSEHPHTIVEDPTLKRNAQEGVLEVQLLSLHPHATVGDEYASTHSDKLIQQSARYYNDKEEFREQ